MNVLGCFVFLRPVIPGIAVRLSLVPLIVVQLVVGADTSISSRSLPCITGVFGWVLGRSRVVVHVPVVG